MRQAARADAASAPAVTPGAAPVVVVGAGPSGIRFVEELHRRRPDTGIVLYGAEAWQPYNRVRLSSALAGELGWNTLVSDMRLPDSVRIDTRFNCAVRAIDPVARVVRDADGRMQPYSHLVLATGSTPHIPDTPGIRVGGMFTFRDMNDAQQLLARRVRSRTTVVIGGGLLGLEAARAMRRFHTKVVIVEHLDRLMSRQLDTGAGELLARHVQSDGIEVVLGDGIVEVLGKERVAGVHLRSGRLIHCDTLIVATGIRPNLELALDAGLRIGRGVRVDDELRTSHPEIFAIGECAEHRGVVYGLVAPGLEQAAVAAAVIVGDRARYAGTVAATRLKVMRCPVFSVGETGNDGLDGIERELRYEDGTRHGVYRKLIVRRGRLIGAVAVGDWSELSRVQEAVTNRRRVFPWQVARFRKDGRLWPEADAGDIAAWPASATVCNCTGVTCGTLRGALGSGCNSVAELAARTGASTVCGSCKPLLAQLVGIAAQPEAIPGRVGLLGSAMAALLVLAAFLLLAEIPVADSVQGGWQPQVLWLDGFWKQVSGYTLLALGVVASLLSLRKRWPRITFGQYPWWRVAHVVLGVLAVVVLLVHTGLRLGNHLNFLLIASFLALTALGSIAGAVVALERVPNRWTRRVRALSGYWHVVLLWPLPALLGFHILKVYYF